MPTDAPALSKALLSRWAVTPGSLWGLGPHRLLCGDSTRPRGLVPLFQGECWRLLYTSPPYLMARDYEQKQTDWQHLALGFMLAGMENAQPNSDCLVNLGLVHQGRQVVRYWEPWLDACAARGWPLFGWYVWDKLSGFPGKNNGRLAPCHEWLFHFQQGITRAQEWVRTKAMETKSKARRAHSTTRRANGAMEPWRSPGGYACKVPDSVIRARREHRRELDDTNVHPAKQSQEFVASVLLTWAKAGDLVYDPFGGSGSTLFTCHALGRRCVSVELAPLYVALTLERWFRMTGEAPQRLM